MPTKVRFAGVNHTQLPQVVSDGIALKGLPQTTGYPAGYGDLAGAIGKSISRPLNIAFIGDSLTSSGTNWALPFGVSSFFSNGNLTNINSGASAGWVADWQLDGRSTLAASSGVLEADASGKLRYNHASEGFGAWVDVSGGGFFQIPSASQTNSLYVKIVKSKQRSTPATDSTTFLSSLSTMTTAGANIFAEAIKDELGFVARVTTWGIVGDDVSGVSSRYMQMISGVGTPIDAICLLIGTNDQPSSTAAAQELYSRCSTLIDDLKKHCKVVFVGGLFPRGDVAQNIDDAMVVYSQMLKSKCQNSNGGLIYWDAYSTLLDPASLTGALKSTAFTTDNLHLMPFGANLVKRSFLDVFGLSFNSNLNRVPARSNQFYNELDGSGFINPNPCYLGSAGTSSGAGASGRIPTNCTVTRSGGTQTITFSDVASDNQNALRLVVAGSTTANDTHDITQTATLPVVAEGWAGRYVQMVVDIEIEEATNINKLEVACISNPTRTGIYWNNSSRVFTGFNAQNTHRVTFKSEPMLIGSASTTSYTVRFRVGAASGGSGTFVIRSIGLQEYRP